MSYDITLYVKHDGELDWSKIRSVWVKLLSDDGLFFECQPELYLGGEKADDFFSCATYTLDSQPSLVASISIFELNDLEKEELSDVAQAYIGSVSDRCKEVLEVVANNSKRYVQITSYMSRKDYEMVFLKHLANAIIVVCEGVIYIDNDKVWGVNRGIYERLGHSL